MLKLDHIAIASRDLAAGRAEIEARLGVPLQDGGKHGHFGTHNCLLGLEDGLYLEVITIDPDAPKPGIPRWFDLDRFDGPTRFCNWICRTDDIAAAPAKAGVPIALKRGDLRWQMAVPVSGVLPYDNCYPAMIEWEGDVHPAPRLTQRGVALKSFTVLHPEAGALAKELQGSLSDARVRFEPAEVAGFEAVFTGPKGEVVLR